MYLIYCDAIGILGQVGANRESEGLFLEETLKIYKPRPTPCRRTGHSARHLKLKNKILVQLCDRIVDGLVENHLAVDDRFCHTFQRNKSLTNKTFNLYRAAKTAIATIEREELPECRFISGY